MGTSKAATKEVGRLKGFRKFLAVALLLLAAPVAWFGWEDAQIAFTLALAAGDAYPGGIDSTGGLRDDFRQSLVRHPPTKLVRYLSMPSARWRAVACQSLQSASRSQPDADWSGVAVRLMKVALSDECPEVAKRAIDALLYAPDWGREESSELLRLLDGVPSANRVQAEALLVQRARTNRVQRAELLAAWRNSPHLRRRIACIRAANAEEAMSETAKDLALEVARACPTEEARRLAEALGSMLPRRPEYAEAFFSSTPVAQAAALLSLDGQHFASRPQASPMLVASARKAAIAALQSEDAGLRDAGARYISHTADGPAVLVGEVLAAMPESRAAVAARLEHCAFGAAARPISAADCERLVRLWPQLEGEARRSIGVFMAKGIRVSVDPRSQSALFPRGVGPRSPSSAPIFRRLLDDDDVAGLTEPFFEHVAPLPEHDVPRVAAWLRNALENPGSECPRGPQSHQQAEPTSYPEGAVDYFRLLRRRFPTHPATVSLKQQFPALEGDS